MAWRNSRFGYLVDPLNRVSQILRDGIPLATYTYAGRRPVSRSVHASSSAGTTIEYAVEYDDFLRPARILNRIIDPAGTTPLVTWDLTLDGVGNPRRAEIVDPNAGTPDVVDYVYDDLQRLTATQHRPTVGTSCGGESITLNRIGNREAWNDTRREVTIPYGLNNTANEYPAIEGRAVTYDPDGNLSRTEDGHQMRYDHENRLVEVLDPGGTTLAKYTYDALGRRIATTRDGGTTYYFYDGQRVFAEYGGNGLLQRYFVDGPLYVDEHVLMHEEGPTPGTGRDYVYLLGPLYSVLGLVNEEGALVEQYAYTAYGAPEPGPGAGAAPIAGIQGAGYLVITLPASADPVAIVVTAAYDGGLPRYVGAPVTETPYRNRSLLVDEAESAARKTPAEWGDVLIFGSDIVPAAEYDLQIDSGPPGCPILSNPVRLKTARWGDVCGPYDSAAQAWRPPDGNVDVTADVVAALDGFRQRPSVEFAWADMLSYTCSDDQPGHELVSIIDLTMILDAFRGRPYTACWNCCPPPAGWSSSPVRPSNPYYFTGRRGADLATRELARSPHFLVAALLAVHDLRRPNQGDETVGKLGHVVLSRRVQRPPQRGFSAVARIDGQPGATHPVAREHSPGCRISMRHVVDVATGTVIVATNTVGKGLAPPKRRSRRTERRPCRDD